MTTKQPRDRRNGRFDFSNNFERLCVCGQPLGLHLAEPPHPGNIMVNGVLTESDCPKFRPSRKKPKKERP